MYKIVKSEKIHIGRFEIIKDEIEKDGAIHPYSYIRFINGVCIIPFIDDQHIILLREYRHAIRKWVYGFPSGMMEEEESPRQTAERELLEETGYEIEEVIDLGEVYPSFGSTTEKIYLFAAKVKKSKVTTKDVLEIMDMRVVTIEEFETMVEMGEFVQGAGMAAWLKWKSLQV